MATDEEPPAGHPGDAAPGDPPRDQAPRDQAPRDQAPGDPAGQGPAHRDPVPLLAALMALTAVSGLVDAVSYLGLGHVFTANMTGNVVVLGFAAAGAAGFSVPATLTSLAVFLAGAVLAGRLAGHVTGRSRLLVVTMSAEATLAGVAALVAFLAGTTASGWARYAVIAILALAMGMRNAVVRRLGVLDMTTTVLTQTLTALATESRLAGGTNPRAGRRAGAVVAMLAGAVAGGLMYLHVGAALPLLVAGAVNLVTAVAFGAGGRLRPRRPARPGPAA